MTVLRVEIIPFQDHHQADIDLLMTMVAKEFSDSIFSPQSKSIKEVSLLATDKYWVALTNNTVIGTIGLTKLKNNTIALKRMFLREEFRGQGVSKSLLDKVIEFSIDNKVSSIYLGTMTQFKGAQKFYEKHGFKEIPQSALPLDFPVNPVDTIFYRREVNIIYR